MHLYQQTIRWMELMIKDLKVCQSSVLMLVPLEILQGLSIIVVNLIFLYNVY